MFFLAKYIFQPFSIKKNIFKNAFILILINKKIFFKKFELFSACLKAKNLLFIKNILK